MLIDLHVHSNHTRGCTASVREVVHRAREAGLDGLALCRRLKADPKLARVPVMLVSNYPEVQAAAVAAGLAGGFYLVFPLLLGVNLP